MRILMVAGEYPPMKGGISRYSVNLVNALAKKIQIDVATSYASGRIQENANPCTYLHESPKTYPIIAKGDRKNSNRLLNLIAELKPDVVHVQYERGLYEIDTPYQMIYGRLFGSTLDKFLKTSKTPVVSTVHTLYPYNEYRDYIRQRASRKAGRLRILPLKVRVALRTTIMEQRYRLLLHVVGLSSEIISPSKTIRDIVGRGVVIFHGAEPAGYDDLSNEKKNDLRKEFGLPADKKVLLAFGYAGFYKGFELLEGIRLPAGWTLVVKQDRHERGAEQPVKIKDAINLNIGYIDDRALTNLFLSCDAIIFPYQVVSISGVMFDALAHGLPFVASDLKFFREFAEMGLGILATRNEISFSNALETLSQNYVQYRQRVLEFRTNLSWDIIADSHIKLYSTIIEQNRQNSVM